MLDGIDKVKLEGKVSEGNVIRNVQNIHEAYGVMLEDGYSDTKRVLGQISHN